MSVEFCLLLHTLILFASGRGSNCQAIIDHFRDSPLARVALIVCNKAGAGVLDIAARENIPSLLVSRAGMQEPEFLARLMPYKASLLVLAGFLLKIPAALVQAYPNRIINIHPALLPNYGGKGMYGQFVHEAVLSAGDRESGISIHYVNEHYDEGNILLQARCPVQAVDTHETLAARIHRLEHFYFPRVLEFLLLQTDDDGQAVRQ